MLNGLWVFLIVVVWLDYRHRTQRLKYNRPANVMEKAFGGGQRVDKELLDRIERLERRVANLESLIVEHDKRQEFENLRAAV